MFRTRTRAEWCALLEGSNACFAPVLRMSEALTHPHNVARSTFTAVDGIAVPSPAPRFARTPAGVTRGGAEPGEHTDEVLAELGMTPEQIAGLRESGAAHCPPPASSPSRRPTVPSVHGRFGELGA